VTIKVKTKTKPLATVRPPARDVDIGRLVLATDAKTRVVLTPLITDATLEETIDGASTLTLTVHDYNRRLLRSKLVKTACTLELDRVSYRLVKVAHAENAITLTFEETAVNVLRGYDSPKKANRANTTRAQFVESLVREPKAYRIPFRCPERNVRQPIASS
jgi:hypothetical protein